MNFNFDDDNRLVIGKGVTLKPYSPRPFIAREFMTEAEIRANAGDDLILDVELYPSYFMCGFKHLKSGKYIRLDGNFNPHFLSWLLHAYRTIGFNSYKYDIPILWAAYTNQEPSYLKEISNRLIQTDEKPRELQKEFNFKIHKTMHTDIINVCPLKGSLKLYGARIHSPRIQDLPFPDDVSLTPEEIEIVCNYNYNDLDVTHLLVDFMKERLQLRSEMGIRYDEDLMSKSDAQIAEVVITKEVAKKRTNFKPKITIEAGTVYKYSRPKYIRYATPDLQKLLADVMKSDFVVGPFLTIEEPPLLKDRIVNINGLDFSFGIGGLHSCEKCIAYAADEEYGLFDRDVRSYYPDLILTLGLYPENMGPVFLEVFGGFKDERVVAKQTKNFVYDKGLKILINGTSGKLNARNGFSNMHSPKSYFQMTLTGQLSILMLVEMLTCNGFKIISGNTDGIVIYGRKSDYDKLLYWVKFWENETQFVTEEVQYTGYYARDVNAYFAVKDDASIKKDDGSLDEKNRVKLKGPWSEVGSQSGTQLDTNPETLICSDAIKAFLSKGVPVETTIRECKNVTRFVEVRNVKGGAHKDGEYLGKVVRWYFAKGEYGTINYVSSGNKVANSEGAKPLMDLPTNNELPEDLNYDYYINKCRDILIDVGYIKRPKQISFF